ncbi:MAG TPA: hypothetical protein VJK05_05520 [archaeon]|nr:hypothetical protein [archaeon]
MIKRKGRKPEEGEKLPDSADFVEWKKEFDKMSVEQHESKLAELGLDEEDIGDWKADLYGNPEEESKEGKEVKEVKEEKESSINKKEKKKK